MINITTNLCVLINGLGDSLFKKDEVTALDFAKRSAVIIQKNLPNTSSHSSSEMNIIFNGFYRVLESKNNDLFVEKFCNLISIAYGSEHVVLSDIYTLVSSAFFTFGKVSESLEYAGRALVIRMEALGLMAEKTAESHFNLGQLYRIKGSFEQSRKEFRICRSIRLSLFGPLHLSIADCDLWIAHTERAANASLTAYYFYYNSYRTRFLLLGEDHPSVPLAAQLVQDNSQLNGGETTFFCGCQLKDRVMELRWVEAESTSEEYATHVYIDRLHNEEVLLESQLKGLLAAAVKFSCSRQQSQVQTQGLDPSTTVRRLLDLLTLPSKRTYRYSMMAQQQSKSIDMPIDIGIDIEGPDCAASAIATCTSPLPVAPVSGEHQDRPRRTFHASSSSSSPINTNTNTISHGIYNSSPSQTSSPKAFIPQAHTPTRRPPAAVTVSSTVSSAASPALTLTTLRLFPTSDTKLRSDTPTPSPSPSPYSGTFQECSSTSQSESKPETTGRPNSSRKISIVLNDAMPIDASNPNVSPNINPNVSISISKPSREQSCRSIRIVSNTLSDPSIHAHTHAHASVHHHTAPLPTPIPTPAPTSVPFPVPSTGTVLSRDCTGQRVLLRKATAADIMGSIHSKARVLGLLFLLMHPDPNPNPTVLLPTVLLPTVQSSSMQPVIDDTSASSAAIKMGDAKNALSNLFAARRLPATLPSNEEPAGAKGTEASTPLPVVLGKVPRAPPPLPTCWPPVPFIAGDLNMPVFPSALDGSDALGALNVGKKVVPKIKQAHMDCLDSIDGTIWGDSLENLVPIDEIFHDIDDEFLIVPASASKTKKLANAGKPTDTGKFGKNSSAVKKSESILDPQRSQNVSIMLAKFGRRTITEIIQAIVVFDAEAMGLQAVTSLLQYLPTAEEIKAINIFLKANETTGKKTRKGRGISTGNVKDT